MMTITHHFAAAVCLSIASLASAAEFPQNAVAVTAEQAKTYLSGKEVATVASRGPVKLQFKADGFFYGTGGSNSYSGKWRTEDGKLCFSTRGSESCNEVKMVDSVLHLKRDNGDIVPYEAK